MYFMNLSVLFCRSSCSMDFFFLIFLFHRMFLHLNLYRSFIVDLMSSLQRSVVTVCLIVCSWHLIARVFLILFILPLKMVETVANWLFLNWCRGVRQQDVYLQEQLFRPTSLQAGRMSDRSHRRARRRLKTSPYQITIINIFSQNTFI